MEFSEKIKTLREKKGMSQEEVAEAVNVSRRAYQRYESGDSHPRYRDGYKKLAAVFDVDVNYLLTENEEFISTAGELYGRRGQLQAEEILTQISGLLSGGDLSENDQLAFNYDIQRLFFKASDIAREKFNPNKNRKK